MMNLSDHWKNAGCMSVQVGPGIRLFASISRPDLIIVGTSFFLRADYLSERAINTADIFEYFGRSEPEVDRKSHEKEVAITSLERIFDGLKKIPFFQDENMPEEEMKATWGKIICFLNRKNYEKQSRTRHGR